MDSSVSHVILLTCFALSITLALSRFLRGSFSIAQSVNKTSEIVNDILSTNFPRTGNGGNEEIDK